MLEDEVQTEPGLGDQSDGEQQVLDMKSWTSPSPLGYEAIMHLLSLG